MHFEYHRTWCFVVAMLYILYSRSFCYSRSALVSLVGIDKLESHWTCSVITVTVIL